MKEETRKLLVISALGKDRPGAVFGARYLRARDTVLDLAADMGALQEFTAELK